MKTTDTHFDSANQFPEIVEIWDIISSYSTRQTLKNLCLVGRRPLVSAAQRHIFRNMITNISTLVSRGPSTQPDDHETDQIPWFDELAESHLSRYVKSWTIKGEEEDEEYDVFLEDEDPDDPEESSPDAALSALLRSLPRYPNLMALRLETLTLCKSTVSLIGFIRSLKSLDFQDITGPFPLAFAVPLVLEEFRIDIDGDFCYQPKILDNDDEEEPDSDGDGNLENTVVAVSESVHFDSSEDSEDDADGTEWRISSPESLKLLSLKHRFAHHYKYTHIVGRALSLHSPHTNLVSLLFTVSKESGKACLIRLLKASPLLETLAVIFPESLEDDEEKMQEEWEDVVLDRSVCPLLRDVTCCPQLAKAIIPGKLVTAFSMLTNGDYWNKYKPADVSSALRIISLDGIMLTTLQFEKTLAEEAEEFLPLVETLFPALKMLKLTVKDAAKDIREEQDGEALRHWGYNSTARPEVPNEEYNLYVDNVFEDAKSIKDPEDMRFVKNQFNNCFDVDDEEWHVAPSARIALQDSVHSYVSLLSKVTSGRIKLPEGLTNLELTQSRVHKRYMYTREHELMFAMALTHPRFEKLELVRFGVENAYNMPWQRTSSETCKKPGWFFERDGKKFVGAMYIIPGESDGTYKMVEKEEMEVKV
ncbi:hypothetical protein D9613_002509 [Agrocybe pediades]|uniref:Uncharacterized protein n=1 Tax=Agrocybe pediades TaxID=84607 RepID=A0A8H4QP52_9AGAR|nr:hypothetical protein D9613_002509 [Agrocybe pediades]